MNLAERILVTPDIETNYNLCSGGKGGFGYINKNRLNIDRTFPDDKKSVYSEKMKNFAKTEEGKEYFRKLSEKWICIRKEIHYPGTWCNKKHKKETIEKMKETRKNTGLGTSNSQFGTMWITNGTENKKIKKSELDKWIEFGYYKGRKI